MFNFQVRVGGFDEWDPDDYRPHFLPKRHYTTLGLKVACALLAISVLIIVVGNLIR